MSNNWPSNEGSYNRDAELFCSRNVGFEPRVLMPTLNLARRGFRTLPDAGFRLCVLRLQWYQTRASNLTSWHCSDAKTPASSFASWLLQCSWDASFDPHVLVLYWCRGAGFIVCVLVLHEWLWLALRLEYRLCSLMTCLQFRQSTEPPPKFSKLCGWQRRVSKYFEFFFLAAMLSRLD